MCDKKKNSSILVWENKKSQTHAEHFHVRQNIYKAFNTFLICEGVKKCVICCQYIWHIQQTKIKKETSLWIFFFFILLYTKTCGRRSRVAFYSHLFHTYIILQFFFYYLLAPLSLPPFYSFIFNTVKCIEWKRNEGILQKKQ